MEIQVSDIGHIIQLSVAPVFLLTGVGTTLTVLTNRLGRITDRSRVLEERLRTTTDEAVRDELQSELNSLYPRAHMINRAIIFSTACALMVATVIASLFLGDALNVDLSKFIAIAFITAMFSLVLGFIFLLKEILVATGTLYRSKIVPIERIER
ncbi:DUF2721 domain-containing protein [Oxalicibacterium faecigallinarum]|uniref:DUF2721 domain-containing protein n=3 Tax=Oxalicibacterium faecigallinarum TaxID=573741 RepID=A0A8J3EYF0_9BURK|nr:DUF2721 domain-containing protein [Oxalicibacterium faecigallinarum]GGI15950.1 hypothetical protein GCM10008066_01520 [Oxalicibacterium faecigallinarum]